MRHSTEIIAGILWRDIEALGDKEKWEERRDEGKIKTMMIVKI